MPDSPARSEIVFAAALGCLLALSAGPRPAGADAFDDCRQERDPRLSLEGCTAVLEAGEVKGKPLASTYFNRANARRRLGELSGAIEDYDAAVRLDPGSWKYLANRGATHKLNGDVEASLSDLDAALALEPENPRILQIRGSIHRGLGHHARALADLDASIRLRPDYPLALLQRGLAHQALGDPAKAAEDWEAAFERGSDRFAVRTQMRLERLGHYEKQIFYTISSLTPEIRAALEACAADPDC